MRDIPMNPLDSYPLCYHLDGRWPWGQGGWGMMGVWVMED